MTGDEILNFFYKLIDDNIDGDFALELLNLAQENLEAERDWEVLKKKDTSKSSTVGGTYETAYALPTDFVRMVRLNVGSLKVIPIPFQDQIYWKDSARRYFIDHANNNFYLTGVIGTSETIYQLYIYKPTAIVSDTEPMWPFEYMHKRLAFEMSELYFAGLEIDNIEIKKVPKHEEMKKTLTDRMTQWDINLKLESMDYSTVPPGVGISERDDVLNLP